MIIACIPAYNEEKTIASVVLKAMKHVDKVIVCDDGSRDMTAEIAEKLGAIVIRHERNMGYGAALSSLFKKVREIEPDVMVTLDADGQHNPDDIPRLVEPLFKDETDVVIGSRFLEGGEETPRYREMGIKMITKLASAIELVRKVAAKISRIAQSLGHPKAHMWPEDEGFINYLTMTMLHKENYAFLAGFK